jgi:thiol-disulfide isomerase/thioredoxin
MIKQIFIIVIAGVLALLGGFKAHNLINEPMAQDQPQNPPLPAFSLSDLTGKTRSINEWQGKFRIINFWATWCPPCLKEMPEFNQINKEYADKGVQFLGIALDEADLVKEFIAKKSIDYPILLGGDSGIQLAHSMGNLVDTVPFTVFVDKKGQIVKTHMGELDKAELIEIINAFNK